MRLVWVMVLALAAMGATPSPPAVDSRVPVLLHGLHGLPRDTAATGAFTRSFRAVFADQRYATKRRAGGTGAQHSSLVSAFRLVARDPYGGAWKLAVTVTGPWDADTAGATAGSVAPFSRGVPVVVAIETVAPGVVGNAADTTQVAVAILAAHEPRPAFFAEAGRVVGRLAVEALHHRTGDLDLDATLRLDGAQRANDRLPPAPKH